MATKKPAAKKPGTALQPWEAKLAEKAAKAAESAKSSEGSSKSISTRGGQFAIGGAVLADPRVLVCVVLDYAFETSYYHGKFDAKNIESPIAFAIGRNEKELEWHENSTNVDGIEPFEGLVRNHETNQWGSADTGSGKAAKNQRRLMVIAEDDLEDLDKAEAYMLKTPVTSGKAWDNYVRSLQPHGRPPCGVLTEITIIPDSDTQYRLEFKMLGLVDDDIMGAVLDKSDAIEDLLLRPYNKYEEAEDEAPAKGKPGKASKAAPARAGRRR